MRNTGAETPKQNILNKIRNFRVPIFAVLFLVGFVFIASAQLIYAEEKPYKATTVDECVHEKLCVWYHLLLATQVEQHTDTITENIDVRKWTKPIRFRLASKISGIYGAILRGGSFSLHLTPPVNGQNTTIFKNLFHFDRKEN